MDDVRPGLIRKLGVVLFIVALLATLLGIFHLIENWRGNKKWAAYKQKLIIQGKRVDLAAFVPPPVPDHENFAATPFTYRGKRYASLEGFWQMMLYPEGSDDPRSKYPGIAWKYSREQVAGMTSFEAKSAGTVAEENMKKMGITWASFERRQIEYRHAEPGEHYRLIVAATWEKVRQNPEVKRVLMATGDLILKPDHHPEPDAPAAWRYYEILTQIRSELRSEDPIR